MGQISTFISMLVITYMVCLLLMSFGRAMAASLFRAVNAVSARVVAFFE